MLLIYSIRLFILQIRLPADILGLSIDKIIWKDPILYVVTLENLETIGLDVVPAV